MNASFEKVPVNRFFDFSLHSRSRGHAELSMPLKPSYSQEAGVVHGGIISVLADTAAAYAVFPDLEDNETMTGVEFKVNFLRPVVVDDGRLTARSRVVKRGQKIALCEVEVFQRQRIVAKGLFTYLFYRKEPEGDGPPS